MTFKTLLILALALTASAQPVITLTAPAARQGKPVTLTVTLSGSAGANLAAVQFFLPVLPAGATATIGAAGTTASKTIVCQQTIATFGCIVYGLNQTLLADGVLATITLNAPAASTPLPLTVLLGTDPTATTAIAITSGPAFTLPILSPCDLNGDGKIDTLDVRNVIDQIEGVITAVTDYNGDGKTTVIDMQRVSNATVDGVCRIGA